MRLENAYDVDREKKKCPTELPLLPDLDTLAFLLDE